MKLFYLFIVLFISVSSFAQTTTDDDHYQPEVEIGTDNDFLVIVAESDKYYTYGINSTFIWRNEKSIFLDKWFSKKTGYFQSVGLNVTYKPTRHIMKEKV
ncbi:hypothetical protein [uncultured Dokdonia sp.]|uniref:hypothetical protein n=1 Tax=uncultured Dokdonia sp. TaxID=575653 RepID=UPI00261F5AB5|nr:hypothetical protein [uncultured Dokdonia sp.]